MANYTEYIYFCTKSKREYINITEDIKRVVEKSGIVEGMVLVSAMHITAGVYINDAEEGLIEDIEHWLEHLCPEGIGYRHHHTGETNGDAHLKNMLIGHQVIVPITNGRLDLGQWQQIFYAEFDGKRRKRLIVKVLGDKEGVNDEET